MDFNYLEACGVGMEAAGVKVSSIYILHRLLILAIQTGDSPSAELGKLNRLDTLGKWKFGALLGISIAMR